MEIYFVAEYVNYNGNMRILYFIFCISEMHSCSVNM